MMQRETPSPYDTALDAAGTWRNAYGSVLQLHARGARLHGQYHSCTGASGRYRVCGYLGKAPAPGQGRPLALAIAWQAVDAGAPNPSWHWMSGLCGQLLSQDGKAVLLLSHLLVASTAFPGLAAPATYLDQLRYHRSAAPSESVAMPAAVTPRPACTALAGHWHTPDGSQLQLQVDATGRVYGHWYNPSGHWQIDGFTDARAAAAGIAVQSLALTARRPGGDSVVSLTGTLDLASRRLELFALTSASTGADTRYLQTQLSALSFSH